MPMTCSPGLGISGSTQLELARQCVPESERQILRLTPRGSRERCPGEEDLFRELIEINTTDTPAGNVTLASEAMARRLRDAGFPAEDVQVAGPGAARKTWSRGCAGRASTSRCC